MIYNLDIVRLCIVLLPYAVRKDRIIAFLRAITTPLRTLQNTFNIYRVNFDYDLRINSQVVYLEKVLNDNFDEELRRIRVEDNEAVVNQKYIYTDVEDKPRFLGKLFIGSKSESLSYGEDFIVKIPSDLLYEEIKYKLRALLNKNKLPSLRYKIELI